MKPTIKRWATALSLFSALSLSAPLTFAEDLVLLADTTPASGDNPLTKPDEFKKTGPWKIGMSHYGLSGSCIRDETAESAACRYPDRAVTVF